MKAETKTYVSLALSLITAVSIIASAYFLKDTAYENSWVYVMSAWLIVNAIFEVLTRKTKDK